MESPRDAILGAITRPRQEPMAVRRSPGGWVSSLGGHVPARRETIRFLKERIGADFGLLAVAFDDEDGHDRFMVFGVARQADGGWAASGGAGGSGREPAAATVPWANFGAWSSNRRFCAGGRVHGEAVRRVRMLDAAGQAIADTVDGGIALLTRPGHFEPPWSVELYAGDGSLLRRHPLPGGR